MPEKEKIEIIGLQLVTITREFLSELGRERAVRAISLEASLERDLGIDSLGKVELFHRIEDAFKIHLSEDTMAQAQTLNDLLQAIVNAEVITEISKEASAIPIAETLYNPIQAATLVEILYQRAAIEPNRPHIYLQDEKGEEKLITYGDLFKEATKVAGGLHDLGIQTGETVAIMLPTCEDFFYTFFGILLIGAIPVPIYPPFRPDRIEEYALRESNILRNAEVRLLITFQKAERLSELLRVFIVSLKAVITADSLKKSKTKAPNIVIKTEMPALIQYTSGSTSTPKGVLLNHQNLLANIRTAGAALQIKSSDIAVSWLPLYHDMGLIGAWLISFYHANPVVILSPLSFLSRPSRWLWAIHYHRATLSAAPNFAYELCIRRINESEIVGLDLSSWRLTLNGAEAVNPKTIQNFIKKYRSYGFQSKTMFPVYGLAESTVALAFPALNTEPKIDKINRDIFEKEQRAVPISSEKENYLQFVCCGKALPNHYIRIVDENDKEVEERKIGFLHFKGPSSMIGYYRQPEATLAITHDDWLDSGDLAYQVGDQIYITGRKKDLIIKAGRNLYPDEIEEVTSQVGGVRKGCVIAFGAHDPKFGTEKLVIVAETKETKGVILKKIVAEVTEKIAIVLGILPDEVILVPPKTVPKTSSGKLQRSACKQAYLDKKLLRPSIPLWLQITKLYLKGLSSKIGRSLNVFWRSLYTFYVAILVIISTFILWLCALVLPYQAAVMVLKRWAQVATWLIGCPVHIENKQALPSTTPVIYVANHASYIDAIILLAALPKGVQFVAKKELLKVPLLKTILKNLKHITVDRVDFSANLADAQKVLEVLEQKSSIVFFPEGTFTYATGLRPFKLGAFKAAVDTGCPLCPVAIHGARDILRADSFLLTPGKIKVTIGDMLYPQSNEWQEVIRLHNLARATIAEFCGELPIDY